jgi:hypothetical protein
MQVSNVPSGRFESAILQDIKEWSGAEFERDPSKGGLLHLEAVNRTASELLDLFLLNTKKYDDLELGKLFYPSAVKKPNDHPRIAHLWTFHSDLARKANRMPMLFVKETAKPTLVMLQEEYIDLCDKGVLSLEYSFVTFEWLALTEVISFDAFVRTLQL